MIHILMMDSKIDGKQMLRVFKKEEDANRAMSDLIEQLRESDGIVPGLGKLDKDALIYVANCEVDENYTGKF